MKANIELRLGEGVMMEFVLVRAGRFVMGGVKDLLHNSNSSHLVRLTQDYYLARYQISRKQWELIKSMSLGESDKRDHPLSGVSWDDVINKSMASQTEITFVGFVHRLLVDQHPSFANWKVTLPTEAQWEYAAHGGHLANESEIINDKLGVYPKYAGGDDPLSVAWFDENSGYSAVAIGLRQPNALGLYDMSGNVWEWCYDTCNFEVDPYDLRIGRETIDPVVEKRTDPARVLHGGSFQNRKGGCQPGYRDGARSGNVSVNNGFRLCIAPRMP